MNVTLLPPADKELDDAFHYYEDQLQGLGKKFIEEFNSTVSTLSNTPFGWSLVSDSTRRINLKRFPYLILYVIEGNTILITCIAHQHRDPRYYISRTI